MAEEGGLRPGDQASRPVPRRNFIVWYLAGLLTAAGAAVVAPILVYVYPPRGANRSLDITIKLDRSPDDLQDGEAVKFKSPTDTGFVLRDGGGDNAPGKITFAGYVVKELPGSFSVLAVDCSHLGCSVEFDPDTRGFVCPCHGSRFSSSGQVVHGPAVYPLAHLSWSPGPNPGEIVVSGISLPGVG